MADSLTYAGEPESWGHGGDQLYRYKFTFLADASSPSNDATATAAMRGIPIRVYAVFNTKPTNTTTLIEMFHHHRS